MQRDKKRIGVMKETIYWGVGHICERCLEQHTDIIPEFLVDSFSNQKIVCGKMVKHPSQIEDWARYYVVITAKNYGDIEKVLESKGLQKGRDYLWYKDFFSCHRPSITENINLVRAYVQKHLKNNGPIMLVSPIVNMRNQKVFMDFLKEYIERRPQEVVIFSPLQVVSCEKLSRKLGCAVYDVPDIFGNNRLEYEDFFACSCSLSEEEQKWLEHLEERKASSNREETMNYSRVLFCYYKVIIEALCPSKILIWGNWVRESYILGYLAQIYGIKYGYLEHGWIPGTIQFDPRGIAGQGIYAVEHDVLDDIAVTEVELEKVRKVKQYVIKKRLDTRAFCKTEEDMFALRRMDPHKQTVFLVGMDEFGMGMNPFSEYWKNYVSDIYRSVEEILKDLIKICDDEHWNLIFKPHPRNQMPAGDDIDLSKVIYVKNAEIDQLIELSDVVVSMASAVDYKALILKTPLVQVGKTGLNGKGCTYEVTQREDLKKNIFAALKMGMTEKQQKNYDIFLARLLKRYLWDDMSEKEMPYGLTLDIDFGEDETYESSSICTN